MPKMSSPKESLESRPALPPGVYEFRLDGFKPKKSKNGDSVNMNPTMKVINNAQFNDSRVFENLNSKAGFVAKDLFHALGLQMEGPDKNDWPLEYTGTDADPSTWNITSPAIGRTGRVEIALGDDGKGGSSPKVKRYFCQVQSCTEKHRESLL